MDNQKNQSISLLSEMLTTYQSTGQFAQYKLKYLTPCCPNSIHEIEEYSQMLSKADQKINSLSRCIAWLNQLETELKT